MPPESIIPSSPPLLPVSFTTIGRASSPVAEEEENVTSLNDRQQLPRGQKRLYQDAGYEPSSEDPPVFSSDDWPPPEYLERYCRNSGIGRRKRRVLPAHFLGSSGLPYSDFSESSDANAGRTSDGVEEDNNDDDDCEEDEGDISIQTIQPPRREDSDGLHSEQSTGWMGSSAKTEETEITLPGSDDSFSNFWRKPDEFKLKTRAESTANNIIQTAIEDGIEDVDLSGINLSEVPFEIISLNSLISQPHCLAESDALPPSYYAPLTPLLRLFLGNNSLTKLPPHLFTLEHMTTLSIRNNKLRDIPHWIGRLKDLQSLVVGGNRLFYFPWQIMHLEKLGSGEAHSVMCWPNRLLSPQSASINTGPEDGGTAEETSKNSKQPANGNNAGNRFHIPLRTSRHLTRNFVTSSELFIFNILGKAGTSAPSISQNPPSLWPELSVTPDLKPDIPTDLPCPASPPILPKESVSRVPSLIELSLRTISKDKIWSASKEWQRKDFYSSLYIPEHISQLIEKALFDSAGGQPGWMKRCGVCGVEYVIPAAEWIEWWDFTSKIGKSRQGSVTPDYVGAISVANPNDPAAISALQTDGGDASSLTTARLPLLRRACTLACAQDWLLERYPPEN